MMGYRASIYQLLLLILAGSTLMCIFFWKHLTLAGFFEIFYLEMGAAIIGFEIVGLQRMASCPMSRKERSYAICTSIGIISLTISSVAKFIFDIVTGRQFPIWASAAFMGIYLPMLLYSRSGRLNTYGRVPKELEDK